MVEVANGGIVLERERELSAVQAACSAVGSGHGRLIVVDGPAGVGKTLLISAAAQAAAAAGLEVARTRGGELEQDLGWGIAVDLLDAVLAGRSREERERLFSGRGRWAATVLEGREVDDGGDRVVRADTVQIVAGLARLTGELAAERPIALLVDDAHWADGPSLRWLVHLSSRLESLPVLIVLGVRARQGAESEMVARVQAAASDRLALSPLSRTATGALVAARLGAGDAAVDAAIHEVTGGNPFLLDQLIRHLVAGPVDPGTVRAARPQELGALIWPRVLALGPQARALAEAVSVLGVRTPLRRAASLAGLSREAAASVADQLVEAGVFMDAVPLDFAHPLVRSVVAAEVSAARTDELHRRAARVLIEDRADPEAAAVLLLASEPVDERWAADLLLEGAEHAMSRAAYEGAARLLTRALAERTLAPDRRHSARVELGRALISAGQSEGIEPLREAFADTSRPLERGMLALELGDALFGLAHPRDAIEIYQLGAEAVGSEDERLRLHLLAQAGFAALAAQGEVDDADSLIAAVIGAGRRSRAGDDRAALSFAAISAFWMGAAAEVCVPLAERALAAEPYAARAANWTPDLTFLLVILAFCDAYERRDAFLDQAIDRAQNRLAPAEIVAYARWRSFGRMRQGRIADAEADARLTMRPLELLARGQSATALYTAALIPPLVARGALKEAEQILAACPVDEIDDLDVLLLLEARAELRTAQRRLADARADLERLHKEAANRRMNSLGARTWSADLAILLHATGEELAARDLAAEQLVRARAFGARSSLGHALRASGSVASGTAGLEHLEEAVTILADSSARLEHAQALLTLGSAKRRLGHRRAAIDLLGQALDLASRCGATPLVAVSRAELQLAGARPRRERLSGPEALTAAELRVAILAAQGATNAEIAHELVVTRRTVETHLTSTYRKLDIKRRDELPAALLQDG